MGAWGYDVSGRLGCLAGTTEHARAICFYRSGMDSARK
jgi:hypothetical protein